MNEGELDEAGPESESERGDVHVEGPPAIAIGIASTVTVESVFYPRLSESWLRDAREEAASQPFRDARRRQIVAATIFADSYLYEWVRDEVLGGRDDKWVRLFDLFPDGDRRSVEDRWKETSRELASMNLIPRRPNLGGSQWPQFLLLVSYRNGLVHGKASRPDGSHFPDDWAPVPKMNDLEALDPEWAVTTVVEMVRLLHRAAGTDVPEWVEG